MSISKPECPRDEIPANPPWATEEIPGKPDPITITSTNQQSPDTSSSDSTISGVVNNNQDD